MLTHAFYKNNSRAVLIAGDLDFRPVVESLIRLGTWVEVASVKTNTAKDLQRAADKHREIIFPDFYDWSTSEFKKSHPIPIHIVDSGDPGATGWSLKKIGSQNRNHVALWTKGKEHMIRVAALDSALRAVEVQQSFTVRFSGDIELLQRYFEAVYGKIDWE
jgi:hypothetical protein